MLERYRRVLGAPHVLALVVSSVLARTPIGMVSLALVLYVEGLTGTFGSAGAGTAAVAVAAGGGSPLQGRLVDHHGHRKNLLAWVGGPVGGLVAGVAPGGGGGAAAGPPPPPPRRGG